MTFRKAVVGLGAALTMLGAMESPALSAPPGQQTFTFEYHGPLPGEGPVPLDFVAAGPVSGTGTNINISSRETGRAFHDVDLLTFEDGRTLTIRINGVDQTEFFDPETCRGGFSTRGNFRAIAGTGDLDGVKLHGHFVTEGTFSAPVDPSSPEGCDFSAARADVVVNASGKAKA